MSSFKHEFHQGKPVLTRAWRDCNNVVSCTAFTLIWNFISWGSVLLADGGKISVNGVNYHTFSEAYAAHPIAAAMFLFPLIGVMMLYHTLALWINQTQIKIEGGEFIVSRGPLFWMPSQIRIPLSDIKQAYVQEYSAYAENKHPIVRYRLMIQRYSGGDFILESGILAYADAQILEQWLEQVPHEVYLKAS